MKIVTLLKRIAIGLTLVSGLVYAVSRTSSFYVLVLVEIFMIPCMWESWKIKRKATELLKNYSKVDKTEEQFLRNPNNLQERVSAVLMCVIGATFPIIGFISSKIANGSELLTTLFLWFVFLMFLVEIRVCFIDSKQLSIYTFVSGQLELFFYLYVSIPVTLGLCFHFFNLKFLIIFIPVSVAAADVGGLMFGKLLARRKENGKPRFSLSALSPNKSVEGAVGSVIVPALFALVFPQFFRFTNVWMGVEWASPHSYSYFALYAAVIGGFSIIGDLVESYLKRMVYVKESGRALGVHGGMLDRLDSTIFSVPFCFIISYYGLDKFFIV